MQYSYNRLQTYFKETLPSPEILADKITFHSSEIEELIPLGSDTILDIKILPDKSAWLMSHRGMAREIANILQIPMENDPFLVEPNLVQSDKIQIELQSPNCDFYSSSLIEGVKIESSPAWLKNQLEVIGQRSINNIVDATNYIMFGLGQPLHAFDADKLANENGVYKITVRQAALGEEITVLTGETYKLDQDDAVIVDAVSGNLIGIAGVKGGQVAAVDAKTKNILLESAHFDRVAVRKTAKRLKLQTDAAKRFENGISRKVAAIAMGELVKKVIELGGGSVSAQSFSGEFSESRKAVTCSIEKLNSVLGLNLESGDVEKILQSFGAEASSVVDGEIKLTPSFERDDLIIAEDLIEDIGRIYGFLQIKSIVPTKEKVQKFNQRFFYAEKIRQALIGLGFSEIYTSSFRNQDKVKLENALASDKQFLRSTLTQNLIEARQHNIPHRDLLGLSGVKIFEIGNVFDIKDEEFRIALGVQSGTTYKAKTDEPLLVVALEGIKTTLGQEPELLYNQEGVVEFSLDKLISKLPATEAYETLVTYESNQYRTFSLFPAISRDIAMWVPEATEVQTILALLQENSGSECALISHLDTFTKEGKTSHAFRLVFQAPDRTLRDTEVEAVMDQIYLKVAVAGFEVR